MNTLAVPKGYAALHTFLGYSLRLFDGINRFLSYLQRPFTAISLVIEQWRTRIETKHDLDKWNGENDGGRSDDERD